VLPINSSFKKQSTKQKAKHSAHLKCTTSQPPFIVFLSGIQFVLLLCPIPLPSYSNQIMSHRLAPASDLVLKQIPNHSDRHRSLMTHLDGCERRGTSNEAMGITWSLGPKRYATSSKWNAGPIWQSRSAASCFSVQRHMWPRSVFLRRIPLLTLSVPQRKPSRCLSVYLPPAYGECILFSHLQRYAIPPRTR
jgi:hypothetical protein